MRLVTIISLAVIAVLLIAWDIYVAYKVRKRANSPETGPTISEVVHGSARKFLLIPVGVGVLIGHLFWPQVPTDYVDCQQTCEKNRAKVCAASTEKDPR